MLHGYDVIDSCHLETQKAIPQKPVFGFFLQKHHGANKGVKIRLHIKKIILS